MGIVNYIYIFIEPLLHLNEANTTNTAVRQCEYIYIITITIIINNKQRENLLPLIDSWFTFISSMYNTLDNINGDKYI